MKRRLPSWPAEMVCRHHFDVRGRRIGCYPKAADEG